MNAPAPITHDETRLGRPVASPYICLIRPPSLSSKFDRGDSIPPPLGLAYMAAALRQAGIRAHVVDASGEAPNRTDPGAHTLVYYGLTIEESAERVDPAADIIGVSVMFSLHWPMAKSLI